MPLRREIRLRRHARDAAKPDPVRLPELQHRHLGSDERIDPPTVRQHDTSGSRRPRPSERDRTATQRKIRLRHPTDRAIARTEDRHPFALARRSFSFHPVGRNPFGQHPSRAETNRRSHTAARTSG